MTLAIFDFDGTITTEDSFIQFILFTHGGGKAFLTSLFLSPWIVLYLLKQYPNWKLKEHALTAFYNDMDEKEFEKLCIDFAQQGLPKLLRPAALQKILWHKQQGHKVVVVSASPENYLSLWCQAQRLDCIATKLQFNNGKLTGNIDGKNCHGEEKVRRIKENYNLAEFDHIRAYGDTEGDLALKQIAQEFFYKPFRQ